MIGILIDKKIIVKYQLNKLIEISGKQPKTNDDVGIIFIIPDNVYNKLKKNKKWRR